MNPINTYFNRCDYLIYSIGKISKIALPNINIFLNGLMTNYTLFKRITIGIGISYVTGIDGYSFLISLEGFLNGYVGGTHFMWEIVKYVDQVYTQGVQ